MGVPPCVCGHPADEHIQDPYGHCLYARRGVGCECPEFTASR
jgi:hypothetical protein